MTVKVQIPPSNIPVTEQTTGLMHRVWRSFFEAIVTRAGGINGALQPEDPTLTALAGLDSSPGILRQTGADTFAKVAGVSGTFTTADAKTVTVTNGVITSIV